jgi:hypothetical protein
MFRYSSRFWLYAPFAVFLAIAIAVMAYWKVASDAFEKKLAALKGHDAAPGITLDWDSVVISGFPFRLDADFTNFSVHGAAARGPFVWKTKAFALHALTYGMSKTVYEAAGPQRLEWTGADGVHTADFLPATLRASTIADKRGLVRADIDALDAGGADFIARRLQFHMRRDPDGRDIDLMVKADAIKTGAKPRDVQAYVTLSHSDKLAPLLEGRAFWPDAARGWAAAGGEMRITNGVNPDAAARILSALY